MKNRLLLILASVAFAAAPHARATLIDFNGSATDYTGNFTANNGASVAWGASSGVGTPATGGLTGLNTAGGSTIIYNPGGNFAGHSLTAGSSYTLELFARTNTFTGTGSGFGVLHLGFGTSSALAFNSQVVEQFAARVQGTATAGQMVLAYRNVATSGGTATNSALGAAFTLANDTWYKFSTTITKSSTAGAWDLTVSLQNWGSDGTSFVSTIASESATGIANTALYNDSSLFAGYYARNTTGTPRQFIAADNFTVIPEPSSFAALAGLAGLGLAASRRRRA